MVIRYFKLFVKFMRGNGQNSYAIQKVVRNGTVTYLPVVKESGMTAEWVPIVKVYDTYMLLKVEKPGGMTEAECHQHINGYKEQIELERIANEITVVYNPV